MIENRDDRLGMLVDRYPAKSSKFIFVQPSQTLASLAQDYKNAADRLAVTFQGNSIDDSLLKPFLFLYRHAFELQLKSMTVAWKFTSAKMYGRQIPSPSGVEKALRKSGHRLIDLFSKIDQSYKTVLPEGPALLKASLEVIDLLNRLDFEGTRFRYPQSDESIHETNDLAGWSMDFISLHEDFQVGFDDLTAYDDYYSNAIEMLDERDEV
ncbi:MAG: hypothetical protein L0H71_09315 [Yaniella sp.]|nr:hypothetical protein [Yaniella sp.]